MTDDLKGGCACGAVRYQLASTPMFVHCCHCRDCQRQTGSAFVLNALIEADRVTLLSGNVEPVAVPTDSGRPHVLQGSGLERLRRRRSHAALRSRRHARQSRGDDADLHIYVRSKLPWVALPEGVPSFDDSRKLWPAASLERRRAILG